MEKKRVLKAKRKRAALLIQCIARMVIAKERVRRIKHLRRTRYTYIYSRLVNVTDDWHFYALFRS
jgi:hypothetical protein